MISFELESYKRSEHNEKKKETQAENNFWVGGQKTNAAATKN